ncbi:MAG: hypothetical protein ACK50V_06490 [Alphaproteobacteria bacterium]|jgi:hypothetical protein
MKTIPGGRALERRQNPLGPFSAIVDGFGLRLTPEERAAFQHHMIKSHYPYSDYMTVRIVVEAFCNTDVFPDTFATLTYIVSRLVNEGYKEENLLSFVGQRLVEITRRGGYGAFKALVDLENPVTLAGIKETLSPTYLDQEAVSLDLGALVTHLAHGGETPSLATLDQFPTLVKKPFVSCVTAPSMYQPYTLETLPESWAYDLQHSVKNERIRNHILAHLTPEIVNSYSPSVLTYLLERLPSDHVRARVMQFFTAENQRAFSTVGNFEGNLLPAFADVYSYELQEALLAHFKKVSTDSYFDRMDRIAQCLFKVMFSQVERAYSLVLDKSIREEFGNLLSPIFQGREDVEEVLPPLIKALSLLPTLEERGAYLKAALERRDGPEASCKMAPVLREDLRLILETIEDEEMKILLMQLCQKESFLELTSGQEKQVLETLAGIDDVFLAARIAKKLVLHFENGVLMTPKDALGFIEALEEGADYNPDLDLYERNFLVFLKREREGTLSYKATPRSTYASYTTAHAFYTGGY